MTRHVLKTLPPYFDAVACGAKNFEVRKDDRGFQKGDTVVLKRYEIGRRYFGFGPCPWESSDEPEMHFRIGWVLTGGRFGIEPGYVVFSLEIPR